MSAHDMMPVSCKLSNTALEAHSMSYNVTMITAQKSVPVEHMCTDRREECLSSQQKEQLELVCCSDHMCSYRSLCSA